MHPYFQDAYENYRYDVPKLHPGAPRPTNIVVTVYLDHRQDLDLLPKYYPNTKGNNSHFASCNIKLCNPAATILLFGSKKRGKLVCVGAMVPNIGFYALMYVRLQLLRLGTKAVFRNPNVSNVVMTGNFDIFIDMARFVAANEGNCNYAPDTFSGCSYSPYGLDKVVKGKRGGKKAGNKAKMVLFEGGNYNLMGLNSYREAFRMASDAYAVVKRFEGTPRNLQKGQKIVPIRINELTKARIEFNSEQTKRSADSSEGSESKRQKVQTPVY